jgi:hypothetical protein
MADDREDDFERLAREILSPSEYEQVRLLRTRFQADLPGSARLNLQSRPGPRAAAAINRSLNEYLQQVASLVGRKKFQLLFGFPPDQTIDLVNPNVTNSRR